MTGVAVLIMLIAIIIIWGGLAVSVTALVSRGHREQAEDRARASAEAHEHLRAGAHEHLRAGAVRE